jgi:hypothetical protein
MNDPTLEEDESPGHVGSSGHKREWTTPQLVVETVASATEGNFLNESGDDGLGSGS